MQGFFFQKHSTKHSSGELRQNKFTAVLTDRLTYRFGESFIGHVCCLQDAPCILASDGDVRQLGVQTLFSAGGPITVLEGLV